MIARLAKTVGTHTIAAAVVLLVLGAAGAGMTLTAGTTDAPGLAVADAAKATPHPTPAADRSEDADDAAEVDAPEVEATPSTRPTDTHGYCVSQVAQSDTGDANHGEVVREAAHACGKETASPEATPEAKAGGKAYGRDHGTGKPAGVPARTR